MHDAAADLQAIGKLVGGVAEDLRNLLTAINGYGDLVLQRLDEESPARKDVEAIRRAGARAASLTRQLLSLTRRHVSDPRLLDVNAVLADLDPVVRRLLGVEVQVIRDRAPDIARVRADSAQLDQLILNIIVNVRDALGASAPLVLETGNADLTDPSAARQAGVAPGAYVRLAAGERPPGASALRPARLFPLPGIGSASGPRGWLGLSTAYRIANQLGGAVSAASETGHGCTIELWLPRAPSGDRARDASASETRAAGAQTILVAEDEEMLRSLVRDVLERDGYTVLAAQDGAEALRLCEHHDGPIDLLLTDVVMPNMSGVELAERLAVLRPGMRVLTVSGHGSGGDAAASGSPARRTSFLDKPFTPDALLLRVKELLDAPRPAG